jgi:hypothetical protein
MSARIFVFTCLLLFVASCKGRLDKHGELFSSVMKSEEGLFRGVELGELKDNVEQSEGVVPDESDTDFLLFNENIGVTGNYTIRYGFENSALSEILVSAEFDNRSEGVEMLSGFRSYFNERYGIYAKEGGYLVWKGNSKDNPGVVIEMIDESEFTDFGQFSLTFYREPAAAPFQEIESEEPTS